MIQIVSAEEMRQIERLTVEAGTPLDALMQAAGKAVAEAAAEASAGGRILILAGPGNNGGDGLVAAAHLERRGYPVVVYTFHREDLMEYGGAVVAAESDEAGSSLRALARESHVIVDALLGIGSTRPPEGVLADILRTVNTHRAQGALRIAVDIPTGVNADTGAVPGQAFRADLTLSMGFVKCGSVLFPGAEFGGRLQQVDVGIPPHLGDTVRTFVPSDEDIARLLPTRSAASNKGTSGRLLVIGGSRDYLGAPALACLAAYRAGGGLIEAAVPVYVQQSVAAHVPEAIFRPLPEAEGRLSLDALPEIARGLDHAKAVVFGPGMGLSDATVQLTRHFLRALAQSSKPGLVDADGLNALARLDDWWKEHVDLVVTPHPGEMARLTGLSIADIQADRVDVARRYAAQWQKVVVLKGAGTVVAAPDGRASVNPTGGPNLATAGTGDILSGIIGSLLAQGCSTFDAALAGTYLHGKAGDVLREEQGDAGTIASDLLFQLPRVRMSILKQYEESR